MYVYAEKTSWEPVDEAMTLCSTILSLLLLQDAVKLGEKKIQSPPAPSSGTTTSVRVGDGGSGREKKCCQSCMSWCQQCCGALIVSLSHLATSELTSNHTGQRAYTHSAFKRKS